MSLENVIRNCYSRISKNSLSSRYVKTSLKISDEFTCYRVASIDKSSNLGQLSRSSNKLLKNQKNIFSLNNNAYHSLCGQSYNYYQTSNSVNYTLFQKRNISKESDKSSLQIYTEWFDSLSGSFPVLKVMDGIQAFHNYTHLPWWLTIILGTALLRTTLSFPFVIYQNLILAKYVNVTVEMEKLSKKLNMETAIDIKKFNWNKRTAAFMYNRSAKRIMKGLIMRDNCHPFKASVPIWIQLPFWISTSIALRNMAAMLPERTIDSVILYQELCCGGFQWIPNLCIPDASLIIPVVLALGNLLIIEINVLQRPESNSKPRRVLTYVLRGLAVTMIPLGYFIPSGVVLYWTTSAYCALVQNLIIIHPRFRRSARIPDSKLDKEHPYQYIWTRNKERFQSYGYFK